MAVTVTIKKTGVQGDVRYVSADVAFDNSYPTNGLALAASDLGVKGGTVQFLVATPRAGLIFEYDYSASKLKAFYPTGGAAAAPASATAVPITASGASTASAVDATRPNLVAGVGKEVGNTADLSTITTRVWAIVTGV